MHDARRGRTRQTLGHVNRPKNCDICVTRRSARWRRALSAAPGEVKMREQAVEAFLACRCFCHCACPPPNRPKRHSHRPTTRLKNKSAKPPMVRREKDRTSQGRAPRAIALDGYQKSHRAAREVLGEHRRGRRPKVSSNSESFASTTKQHPQSGMRFSPHEPCNAPERLIALRPNVCTAAFQQAEMLNDLEEMRQCRK
jgi:hypothetical protein